MAGVAVFIYLLLAFGTLWLSMAGSRPRTLAEWTRILKGHVEECTGLSFLEEPIVVGLEEPEWQSLLAQLRRSGSRWWNEVWGVYLADSTTFPPARIYLHADTVRMLEASGPVHHGKVLVIGTLAHELAHCLQEQQFCLVSGQATRP